MVSQREDCHVISHVVRHDFRTLPERQGWNEMDFIIDTEIQMKQKCVAAYRGSSLNGRLSVMTKRANSNVMPIIPIQQFTADLVSDQILAEGKGLKRSVVVETVFKKRSAIQ